MHIEAFLQVLPIMVKGMVGVFVVMLVICGALVLLRHIPPQSQEDDTES